MDTPLQTAIAIANEPLTPAQADFEKLSHRLKYIIEGLDDMEELQTKEAKVIWTDFQLEIQKVVSISNVLVNQRLK